MYERVALSMKRAVTLILVLTLLTSFCCLASAEWIYKDTEMEQEDRALWEKLMVLSDAPLGEIGGTSRSISV